MGTPIGSNKHSGALVRSAGAEWIANFDRVLNPVPVRAPTRIDFGGGWTDVPPYDVEQGGFVCNVAISRYATVQFTGLADKTAEPEFVVQREGDRALLRGVARKFDVRGARISLSNDFPVAA